MLNARYHEQEAYIVAAGRRARRDHDRHQHGRPRHRHPARRQCRHAHPPGAGHRTIREGRARASRSACREIRAAGRAPEGEAALAAGGLFVIGTERHESRRIDNQLRGRSGRQGDPGRSKFFLSLEDDLMRIFGSDRIDGMLQKLGLKEGEAIVHPWINKALEKAQQKVEARNFDIRKNLLKFDNVMNDQRKVIFDQRIELMKDDSGAETVADMRHEVIDDLVAKHMPENAYPEQWDVAGLKEELKRVLDLDLPVDDWAKEEGIADEEMRERIEQARRRAHGRQGRAVGPRRDALRREDDPAADARPSLARAPGHARPSAPGDRLPRLRPARSAERIQVRSLRPVRGDDRASARGGDGAADARRDRAAGRAAAELPPMEAHKIDPNTGEDEMAARRRRRRWAGGGRRRPQSERSGDLGQGRPQRGLPVRLAARSTSTATAG